MSTIVEYSRQYTAQAELEIDDIGNFTILAEDVFGNVYYLTASTDSGYTYILECGPFSEVIVPGDNSFCQWTYTKNKFSQARIKKCIDKFLNGKNNTIIYAEVCDYSSVKDKILDPREVLIKQI